MVFLTPDELLKIEKAVNWLLRVFREVHNKTNRIEFAVDASADALWWIWLLDANKVRVCHHRMPIIEGMKLVDFTEILQLRTNPLFIILYPEWEFAYGDELRFGFRKQ